MKERMSYTSLDNPLFLAICGLLAAHPDHLFTRREICSLLERSKTTHMIHLIETGVEMAYFHCMVSTAGNRETFYYRISNFFLQTQPILEKGWDN